MKSAARSGVDVAIVSQSYPPDSRIAYYCAQFFAEELVDAGVRMFQYPSGMMHAKVVCIDDAWAMLGTANFDNRSMFLNFEQMAVLDGGAVVRDIAAELDRLVSVCREVDEATLASRSRLSRLCSAGARLFAPLL